MGTDFPKRVLKSRLGGGDFDTIKSSHFFSSLLKAYSIIREKIRNKEPILFVCLSGHTLPILKTYFAKSKGKMYFMNHKWIAGFLTNSRNVKYNIERFFLNPNEYSTKNRRKTCLKMYQGLKGISAMPTLIVAIGGGNNLNIILNEVKMMKNPIKIVMTRDTDCIRSHEVDFPIFVNDEHPWIQELLLTLFLRCFDNK